MKVLKTPIMIDFFRFDLLTTSTRLKSYVILSFFLIYLYFSDVDLAAAEITLQQFLSLQPSTLPGDRTGP